MGDQLSIGMNCPQCGGAVQLTEGARVISCQYCNTVLLVEGDKGIFTMMFKNELDANSCKKQVQAWFGRGYKARDLVEKAKISEVFPLYIPFWRVVGKAAGWVCGYEVHHHGKTSHTEYLEKRVFRDFVWSEIACDPGDIGVRSLPVSTGMVLPHQEGDVPTFEPTSTADQAKERGMQGIHAMAENSVRVPNVTFRKIITIPRSIALVYYPIWMVRYNYGDRSYFATVDGVTGQVLSGRAPGDPFYQALAMTGGAAGGGVVAGLAIGCSLLFGCGLPLVVVGLICGAVIFYFSYRFFRHGSEIVEGDIQANYSKPSSITSNTIDLQKLLGGF